MRQNAGVQHIGIGDDDAAGLARRFAPLARGVAVVGLNCDRLTQITQQFAQRCELIVRQRLRRKKIQRSRLRIAQQGVEHRQVVAQRLARSRRGHHADVLAAQHTVDGGRLMRVELIDAARLQRFTQA